MILFNTNFLSTPRSPTWYLHLKFSKKETFPDLIYLICVLNVGNTASTIQLDRVRFKSGYISNITTSYRSIWKMINYFKSTSSLAGTQTKPEQYEPPYQFIFPETKINFDSSII
jgi:hypothetical protein